MDCSLPARQLNLLTRCPLLAGCDRQTIDFALSDAGCSMADFESGQILYQPHSFSRSLGILLSGSVRVTRDALVISVLSPGELFGAAALFNDRPDYATTLTAATPCRVLLLKQELIGRLMDFDTRVRDNYIRYLSGRIRFLSSKVQSLAAAGVDGKLARFLLSRLTPDQPNLVCPATELAQRLGISRASLYRAFESLEERGLIAHRGRRVEVIDFAGLESYPL
ncbi:MAG: Crp/Fnr family transcriptional regulator [Oscillospiraceae bacterium]|nr:Crp/Fnr family transcriptional regulator [Oscillospiraceae bacterium]